MPSFGVARLKDIRAMLADCAPSHGFKIMPHKIRVTWKGRTFPSLQKGAHGDSNPEIQIGNVKQMVRHLHIDLDCARKHISGL